MTLTFCVTLALCSFYSAVHVENEKSREFYCLPMYGALGAGTLTKGLIGVAIPGMVFFFYLLCTHRWSSLRKLHPLPGALLFFVIVVPWYFSVNMKYPGYLRFYFWDDHVARYLTDQFDRAEPWYHFLGVVAGGFFPWVLFLPQMVKDSWRKFDDKNVFLILSVVLPLLFFSFSKSKSLQYILPIYPALAILSGKTVASFVKRSDRKKRGLLYLAWGFSAGFVFYVLIGALWPPLLPAEIRATVSANLIWIGLSLALMVLIFGAYACANARGHWSSPTASYLCTAAGMAGFFLLASQLMVTASTSRSAKALAQHAAPLITHDSQMAIYDTYLPGLIFYLRLDRPIWIVASPEKTTLMGSPYVSRHQPNPPSGYGKVLLDFAEFSEAWKKNTHPLLIFAKAKNRLRLESQLAEGTKRLTGVNEHILVTKP
ncbi:MAG TPA: glycosyltransferase family 39 protein, partial [Candidatus Binatia bacterium]|nr:glycosyltransferase family 39 protein [Candidatus Binatia bacterium]